MKQSDESGLRFLRRYKTKDSFHNQKNGILFEQDPPLLELGLNKDGKKDDLSFFSNFMASLSAADRFSEAI